MADKDQSKDQSAKPETPPNRRDPKFRRDLLLKIPMLPGRRLNTEEALDLRSDLGTIVELDADALLEPLENIVGSKR